MSDLFGKIPIDEKASSVANRPKKRVSKPGGGGGRSSSKRPQKVKKAIRQSTEQKQKRILFWGLVPLLVFALYSAAGSLLVPYYLKTVIPKKIYNSSGFTLTVTEANFNPLTFTLRTGASNLIDSKGNKILSLDALRIKLKPIPLMRTDIISSSFEIDDLELTLVREADGRYNIQPFLPDPGMVKSDDMMGFQELPFYYSLNNISIRNSRLVFTDLVVGTEHKVEEIELRLPTLSNIPFTTPRHTRPYFSAKINGSPFELTGSNIVKNGESSSQSTELVCDINSFDLKTYYSYLPITPPFTLSSGRADGKIELIFDSGREKGNRFHLKMGLRISELSLEGLKDDWQVKVFALNFTGSFNPIKNLLVLDELIVLEPEFSGSKKSFTDGVTALADSLQEKPSDPLLQGDDPILLKLNSLSMSDAQLKLRDQKLQPASMKWQNVHFQLKEAAGHEAGTKNGDPSYSFRLGAAQENKATLLSYEGHISNGKQLEGQLTLFSYPVRPILDELLPKDGKYQGNIDLQGQLSFLFEGEDLLANYRLRDGKMILRDLTIQTADGLLATTPRCSLENLAALPGQLDLGILQADSVRVTASPGQLHTTLTKIRQPEFLIDEINLGGQLILPLTDDGREKLVFSEVNLQARQLKKAASSSQNFSVVAKIDSAGSFSGDGRLGLSPFTMAIKTEFSDLDAAKALQLMGGEKLAQNLTGNLSGGGILTLPETRFTGDLLFLNSWYEAGNDTTLLWQKLMGNEIDFAPAAAFLKAKELIFTNPELSWNKDLKSPSPTTALAVVLGDLFAPKTETGNKENTEKSQINRVIVEGGTISFFDKRSTPSLNLLFTEVDGQLTMLSNQQNTVIPFHFTGLSGGGPWTFSGEITPFQEFLGQSSFELLDLPLMTFEDQLQLSFPDIDGQQGLIDFFWQERVARDQTIGTGEVSITGLQSSSAENQLALALILDDKGRFTHAFDLKEEKDTPSPGILAEVSGQYQRLLLKNSLNPLLLAGEDFSPLVDGGAIRFLPGEFLLAKGGEKALALYLKLLQNHPQVNLLIAHQPAAIDRKAMEQRLQKEENARIEKENEKRFASWTREKEEYERRLAEKKQQAASADETTVAELPISFPAEFEPLTPEPVVVDESMLAELAKSRLDFVANFFATLQYNEQPRVQRQKLQEQGRENLADIPAVSIELFAKQPQ